MDAPMERALRVDVQRQPDVVVVTVSGSATMETSAELNERLVETVQDPIPLLVIDLAGLDFVCSEGLGAIVNAHLKCVRQGGRVRLAGPTEPIRELLDLTRLSKLFSIFPTVNEAIQA